MKQFATRIILIIAAVAVFFTGAGVTFIIYCCSGCETEQTLVMTKEHSCCLQKTVAGKSHSCCASHSDNTSESDQTDADACATHMDKNHCQISRLSADINLSVFRLQVSNPFVWISGTYPALLSGVLCHQVNEGDTYALSESPPIIPPREYLSLIRVLIIWFIMHISCLLCAKLVRYELCITL